jgi:hypothetical protein
MRMPAFTCNLPICNPSSGCNGASFLFKRAAKWTACTVCSCTRVLYWYAVDHARETANALPITVHSQISGANQLLDVLSGLTLQLSRKELTALRKGKSTVYPRRPASDDVTDDRP